MDQEPTPDLNQEPTPDLNQEPTPIEPNNLPQSVKKLNLKRLLITALVLSLVASNIGLAAAYWLRVVSDQEATDQQNSANASLEQTVSSLQKQLTALKSKTAITPTPDELACAPKAPVATTIESIKASITSGNTAALEGYMAKDVKVIVAASDAPAVSSTTEAVSRVSTFITSDITSWGYNFSLPAATLTKYKTGDYKAYFPSTAVVGKATNKKVISFNFDCNGKISTVFLAASEDLL